MKSKTKLLIIYLITPLLVLFALACSDSEGEEKKNNSNAEPTVFVKTIKLRVEPFTDYIPILGVAKAYQEANLSSDEGGRIKKFVNDKGSYVKQSEIIVEMDNDVLKANMDATKAQYEMAENNFIKQEKIFKENVTSELQFLNAKYDRDAAKANYELMKARYDRTFIKAPFSGIVDRKYSEVGELVLPGVPIVSIVNMYRINIEAGVPENYVNDVNRGDSVKVVFKDLKNKEYRAKLSYVGKTITTNNRTFPIEIYLNNSDGTIKPELSAQVYIQKERFETAIVIPEEVVIKTDLGYAVFVEEDGIAKRRIIDIISNSNNEVAVKSGLKGGENLINVGFQNLVDGTKVKVVN
ncbi:MAG: efflux RND transporter periplasmic adaptor subunit [Ignavibacteria bacterium]|nr:efflux RND transporter periplasmic adaptor subunit [Ignavibacteria bacterium]MBT8382101.1 efflux RND transporter periplasmic adaptor subunit [Ignavibacteria bacterium]MBT8392013.1 efflux RND transporter periplasmic adaptor subunit [Ignavibacteria bacterium]NNJ51820.1 efflux RND transporter periplasmic adaptor subunit [Ignavibacteriaceae bacterium]NNL21889.1 efflux RND transporter periplasmic adaptor subunit [Ignavibacteriaceae bacterium]